MKNKISVLRLIDRFRYDEPQARPDRDSVTSEFWWLHGRRISALADIHV